jgi:riboflavin synthase
MFTGIIQEVGKVAKIDQRGEDRRITITAADIPKELKTGDSIAVSGVCLTALDITAKSFAADLAPETWARTSFSRINEGAQVNLELPMQASGRFDGHIVQGHVDGVGKLIALEHIADSGNWWLRIEIPPEIEKYTVFKGSISIEGISLTVANLQKPSSSGCTTVCTIAIIPHTIEQTNLGSLKPGDPLNLEADVIAKYVEKMMHGGPAKSSLTVQELVQQGF